MKKYNRKILLCFSDSHSGFSLGLCNPETKLWHPDGEKYKVTLNETQKFLWNDVFVPGIKKTLDLAGKDKIITFFTGDMTHGNKHISEQTSTREADQEEMAISVFEYILSKKNITTLRGSIGTPAHNYGEGSAELRVFERLKLLYPKKDIDLSYHGLSSVDGFKIDHAHHGPSPGYRDWTKPNAAVGYLRDRIIKDLDAGKHPPDLFLRGHFHEYVKAPTSLERNGIDYDSCLMVIPPMCILGDWGRQATKNLPRVRVGVIAIEIINGKMLQSYKFMETLELRKEEKII